MVDVTASEANTSVEISVQGNSRELPEGKRRVIESGKQTPFSHCSGVGLCIINWVTKRNGGSIWVEETGDNRARISISFPVASTS